MYGPYIRLILDSDEPVQISGHNVVSIKTALTIWRHPNASITHKNM